MMRLIENLNQWVPIRNELRAHGRTIGFIPTMGALHEGHLSLFRQSLHENDVTVGSIFVNPTQFDDASDLQNYPSHLNEDLQKLQAMGVNFVLLPTYSSLYPDDYRYRVTETKLSTQLCGESRPGHFDGVLTVVLKLLNLAQAHRAYFGEKDYQQYLLIKGMAQAYFLDTEIIGCPIVRESDGLAMSSRNERLNSDERHKAPLFYSALKSGSSPEQIRKELQVNGFEVDYIEELNGRRFGAVHLGDVRLIDNVEA